MYNNNIQTLTHVIHPFPPLYDKDSKILILGISADTLPSTSPANAAYSLDKLIDIWSMAIIPWLE